jgi:hypothetical protein
VAANTPNAPSTPILTDAEAGSRMMQLAELQAILEARGVTCVLARNHKLVLRYAEGPYKPSGLTDPQLFVFLPGGCQHVTTDGVNYKLGDQAFPVCDPAAAAVAICAMQPAPS